MRKTSIIASLLLFGAYALGAPDARADNQISSITASESGDATVVTITGTSTPTFTVYKLDRPARVVVDIANAKMVGALDRGEPKAIVNINSWSISSVSATARKARGNKLVRAVVSLARTASYKVKARGNNLVITVRARAPKPAAGASPAELAKARKGEAKARAARRLADARAREATARAERAAARAKKQTDAMEEMKRNVGAGARAERARRERAERRLAAALASTEKAKKRASAAEKAVIRARRESANARASADRRVSTARAEADKARAEARRASSAAAAQLAKAESEREKAAKRLTRATELVAAARVERAAARRARVEATSREKAARSAIAAAKKQRQSAAAAATRAARARDKANRAVATGSSQANRLKAQAESAAAAADKRRAAAEEAALVAEKRRREAETAARAARHREKTSTAEVAAAERRRAAADKARAEAESGRATAEARSRELMSAIKEAKARARDAAARAETYRKAARLAEKQAEAARAKRLTEERAFTAAAKAKVVAVRERDRAERAAAEVAGKLTALKRAELELANRRAASKAAAANAARAHRSSDRSKRAKMARIAKTRSRELAAASRALAARRAELSASERRATELDKARRTAASEVAALKRAAAKARSVREREEAHAARLDAKRGKADQLYRAAETRLAGAKRASAAAEKARRTAELELDKARAERVKARSERVKARSERVKARSERKLASTERERLAAARREAESETAKAVADRAAAAADRAAARKLRVSAAKRRRTRPRTRTRINDVKFVDRADASRVVLGLSAPATPKIIRNTGSSAVLEIDNVAIARDLERTLDTSAFSGPVKAVSSFRDPKNPKKVRLVVDLDRATTGKLKKVGNTYYWDFPKRSKVRTRTATRSPRRAPPRTSHQKSRLASFGASSSSITQQTVAQLRPRRRRVYRGRRIDLNFKDADIHNLLRILATVGGVNIVVPQTVRGTVTVRLKSVPWDQAMEVILSSQGLWYRRSGSLIRVDKRDILDKEDKEAAEAAAARIKSEPPEPEIFTLNYADANQVKGQLGPLLSPKGQIQVDQRTNALIVNDVSAHRRRIIDLASRLDTQTPQIQIEARVVEARTTFAREFGIQWGGNVAATPQGGNATGLIFPNSVQVAGAAEDGQTPNAGVAAVPSDFAVNLPAAIGTGSGGGLGISLGSVGGNFNINLRLSALEDTGTVRIISSPKITTSNNINAKIKSGVSIPVSVVSANGTQTQFVPADLALDVTPSVSQRDCSVSMKITIKKNEADFANTGARGDPSIITKEADTTILVADGETAVVGGIYTRNTGLNYSKVPFFAEIPVIGYFFKNRSENDERAETLLFITPKITNRAFLRCQ